MVEMILISGLAKQEVTIDCNKRVFISKKLNLVFDLAANYLYWLSW